MSARFLVKGRPIHHNRLLTTTTTRARHFCKEHRDTDLHPPARKTSQVITQARRVPLELWFTHCRALLILFSLRLYLRWCILFFYTTGGRHRQVVLWEDTDMCLTCRLQRDPMPVALWKSLRTRRGCRSRVSLPSAGLDAGAQGCPLAACRILCNRCGLSVNWYFV